MSRQAVNLGAADGGLDPIDVCGTGGDKAGSFNISLTFPVVLGTFYRRLEQIVSVDSPLSVLHYPVSIDNCSGAVAQLGERVNGIHEVRGSIPLSSTF